MKKGSLVLMTLIVLFSPLLSGFGIGVDVEELKNSGKVEFINYTGERINTLSIEEIRGIGRDLARELKQPGKNVAEYANKYTVIHAYDETEEAKLGADILVISPHVIIFHIDFIRQLLTGFLMEQYAYSLEDAKVISIFITYYNAVHRGDMAYFNEHYQTEVLKHLTSFNAGIALSYEQWPGNTRLVIPLTTATGRQNLGKIDTSIISDPEVVKELQKTEDRGVEERTSLVEIKERTLTEDKAALEEEKTSQVKAREELTRTTEQLEQEKQELTREEEELAREREKVTTITDPEVKKEREAELAEKEQELAAKREELASQEEEVKTRQDEITARDQDLAREDTKIAQKEEEIARDKESIERDKLINEVKKDPEKFVDEMEDLKSKTVKTEPIIANTLYYLKVKEYLTDGHYNNELYAVDVTTGEKLKEATSVRICGHEYFVTPGGILVITHTNSHRGHFLTLLDAATLEPKLTGTDLIFHRSFIQLRGDYIYAVIWDGQKNYYLGKFNKQLQRVAQSEERIDDNTVFHLFGEQIYVNTPDKKILVLNAQDLIKQSLLDF